jgi:hypothetical protein
MSFAAGVFRITSEYCPIASRRLFSPSALPAQSSYLYRLSTPAMCPFEVSHFLKAFFRFVPLVPYFMHLTLLGFPLLEFFSLLVCLTRVFTLLSRSLIGLTAFPEFSVQNGEDLLVLLLPCELSPI